MEQVKKDALIIALQEEKHRLSTQSRDTKDHELAILYLRTGDVADEIKVEKFEVLDGCVNDVEDMYNIYCL